MGKKIELYHYTSKANARKIMEEGLRGGDNRNGTVFDIAIMRMLGVDMSIPTLFLTAVSRADGRRYGGYILRVTVDEDKVKRVSDDLWVMQGEGILISPDDIDDLEEDYDNGFCRPSIWCDEICPMRDECDYFDEDD